MMYEEDYEPSESLLDGDFSCETTEERVKQLKLR